jgi:hypothetical protein
MDPFTIFISHRHEDADIASLLTDRLLMYGVGALDIFTSGKVSPQKLSDWRPVMEMVARADLFLLLYTAPSELSSTPAEEWSLHFEAGMFAGSGPTDAGKTIVVLSPPNVELSIPISVSPVKATVAQVTRFLKELFGAVSLTGRQLPINRYFADDHRKVEQLAAEICTLLAPPLAVGARMHANSLVLKFQEDLQEPVIPADVEIEMDSMSLRMFGFLKGDGLAWGNIYNSLHGDRTWVYELSEAIYAINNGRYAKPIKSIVSSTEGQSFIPVVYRDETERSGSRLFHVLFVPTDVVPIDPELVFVIAAFRNDMEPIMRPLRQWQTRMGYQQSA